MAGCWTTSLLQLDASPSSFYVSAALWLCLAAYTFLVPYQAIDNATQQRLSLRERFGFDALALLKNHDHRVVFTTAALVAIPFAAFYPYTPPMLKELGLSSISAWMSLGQVTEVVALIGISAILQRWPMKWVVLTGIALGVGRYVLYATGSTVPVLLGLSLHGVAFTFTYISAQIYLAEQIEAAWRTRAQALLIFMTAGVGNLAGYLFTGAWLGACSTVDSSGTNVSWPMYWIGLAAVVFGVFLYFGLSYKGKAAG